MLKVKILNHQFYSQFGLPKRGTVDSAGLDLMACIDEPITLAPSECKLIPTGIAIFINDPSKAAVLLPRSGLGHKHGIVLGNLVGLIDSDYQGELFISVWNRNSDGKPDYVVNRGDKIAQMVIVPVIQEVFEIVDNFNISERGDGGFGHTDAKQGVLRSNSIAITRNGRHCIVAPNPTKSDMYPFVVTALVDHPSWPLTWVCDKDGKYYNKQELSWSEHLLDIVEIL